VIIMIGAVVVSAIGGVSTAILSFVVGVVLVTIARGRWHRLQTA